MQSNNKSFPMENLSMEEREMLEDLLADLKLHPKVLEMQTYIQHGRVTTYDHVERVTAISFWLNNRLHLKADQQTLVRGSFLHDFYLYDWHENDDSHKLHGFHHPRVASENAKKYFHISEPEQDMILTHMWPLIPQRVPRSREAWILCLADKLCSLAETLFER